MTRSIADVHRDAVDLLTRARVPSPDVDADLLIGHELRIGRGEVQARLVTGSAMTDAAVVRVTASVERRAAREPLQHITGRAHFRSLTLEVGPGVFVPRPETELLAQIAIDAIVAVPGSPIAVDLGTGSGAIALSIATEVPHANVWGAENSSLAFIWAKQNFREVGADNARLVFIDLVDALRDLDGTVDVVVSNPPYIPASAIPRDPEVRLFDPEHALYGGQDGLDVVRQVSATGRRLVRDGGTLALEHGESQGAAIAELLADDGWRAIATHRDLLGRDRVTTALR